MLIKIIEPNQPDIILLEAEQDEPWQTLDDANAANVAGIFCGGLSVCYAFIFQNTNQTTIAHVSSIFDENFIAEMFQYITKQGASCNITLARSPNSYKIQREEDIKHGENIEESERYFSRQHAAYTEFFQDKFNLTPTFVEIPHSFFMVLPNGHIRYFNEYLPDEITYEEIPGINLKY